MQVPALNFANYPGYKLVDTTGAGDTFTAGFAVRLAELIHESGQDINAVLQNHTELAKSMVFASSAAFICISRFGASPAIPTREEIRNL